MRPSTSMVRSRAATWSCSARREISMTWATRRSFLEPILHANCGGWPRGESGFACKRIRILNAKIRRRGIPMIDLDFHASGRHFLQIPGPSPVPDRILRAISLPTIDHRGPEFGALGLKVLAGLQAAFKTRHQIGRAHV